jgi:hypothetical protein
MRISLHGESTPGDKIMRIIFEDKKGHGRDWKRVDRADKRDIKRRRKAKLSRLRLSAAII